MKNTVIGILLGIVAAVQLAGCGSDSGGASVQPQAKTVTVAFSLVSTSMLPVRINGIGFAVNLPEGITVATDPSAPKQVIPAALTGGSAVTGSLGNGYQVFGSYSAGKRVKINLLDASGGQGGFSPGEIALLTCTAAEGTTVTEQDVIDLNTPLPYFKVVGYDTVAKSTVDLTPKVKGTVKVTIR